MEINVDAKGNVYRCIEANDAPIVDRQHIPASEEVMHYAETLDFYKQFGKSNDAVVVDTFTPDERAIFASAEAVDATELTECIAMMAHMVLKGSASL